MAGALPRFGNQSSADVKLFLRSRSDKNYESNPVHLHSQILKRLKCFEDKFSNRCSPDKSTEIWVTTSHNFDHYLKCIEIVYGETVYFLNSKECLAILSVASKLSADDCINECMQYLEAVRWSAEEESQIRKVLSSEELKLSPDLAARLHQEDEDDHTNFVEKSIQEMVSLIKGCDLSKTRETVEKDLEGMLAGNASRDVVDVCGRVLLQEFKASINSRDLRTLTRLFKLIQHCNRGILEAALKAFCEDAEFMEYVKQMYNYLEVAVVVFHSIMWFMKATGEGKIIISRASRVSLITAWLPIMGTFWCHRSVEDKFEELDKAVLKVVESLPQVDQKRICLLWAEVYRLNKIDIATPFTLSKYLQYAHSKSAAK